MSRRKCKPDFIQSFFSFWAKKEMARCRTNDKKVARSIFFCNENAISMRFLKIVIVPLSCQSTITEPAKELFKRIIAKAKKTRDDLSCLDIFKSDKGITISWLTLEEGLIHKIDINQLDELGFFVGCGEGYTDISLLDELSE